MDKLPMHSADIVDENIEKIGKLFPNAITEREVDGKVQLGIDFDVLKQELSKEIVDGPQERYQFTWPDKKKSILFANEPTTKTLRLEREKSVGRDGKSGGVDSENIYIEGDNLEALKILRETYLGKVKMIYIDPPYNTGKDFIYKDNRTQKVADYVDNSGQKDEEGNRLVQNTESNGRFHTDWLNMMFPRLKLAKDLLSDDGVIFISIDDNEIDNLKNICNEIFGHINLVAEIPWQSRASVQNDTDFSVNHEYICVYAKRRRQENRRLKESNYAEWHKTNSFVCKPLPLDKNKFGNPDNDPRGLWKADPLDAPNVRPNLTYPIINPNTGEEHLPPRGRCWRFSQEKFSSALKDNRIVWTNNGKGRPQLKVFYEEKKELGSVETSWFEYKTYGTTTEGTKEQIALFDGHKYFDNPKPLKLLKRLIRLANTTENSIIIDFFSGSATTAHAIMQLNAEENGHRKYIMIQLPEVTKENSEAHKAGYYTICDIGEERIRRAGKKIKEETGADIDYGFRCFKVDSSNMKDVYYRPSDVKQPYMELFADNIKEDRTPEDLLFQVMLDLGILLSSKIEEKVITGKKVFSVADGYLLACFDKNVTEDVVIAIAKEHPFYAVFRDSSMAYDCVSINFEQIFKTYSPNTVRKVL